MCKAPLPGRTKTRLAATIGAEPAASARRHFFISPPQVSLSGERPTICDLAASAH
jgi:glycosyltransferase A (GT-A) superfamily protein (DUF2064 family)